MSANSQRPLSSQTHSSHQQEPVSPELLLLMKKSYGVAPNKWNDFENCPDPSSIFRFDLEASLLIFLHSFFQQ